MLLGRGTEEPVGSASTEGAVLEDVVVVLVPAAAAGGMRSCIACCTANVALAGERREGRGGERREMREEEGRGGERRGGEERMVRYTHTSVVWYKHSDVRGEW